MLPSVITWGWVNFKNLQFYVFLLQPPSKDKEFTLERDNIDTQNDLIVGVMIKHMKLVQSMKASCKVEEHKLYRGEESITEECNTIKRKAESAEHCIVFYVSTQLISLCGILPVFFLYSFWPTNTVAKRMVKLNATTSHTYGEENSLSLSIANLCHWWFVWCGTHSTSFTEYLKK